MRSVEEAASPAVRRNRPTKVDLLAEAYRRGILPDNKRVVFEEAVRRGLINVNPSTVPVDREANTALATDLSQQEIQWRDQGARLEARPQADGTTEYVKVQSQFAPTPLNAGQRAAIEKRINETNRERLKLSRQATWGKPASY